MSIEGTAICKQIFSHSILKEAESIFNTGITYIIIKPHKITFDGVEEVRAQQFLGNGLRKKMRSPKGHFHT